MINVKPNYDILHDIEEHHKSILLWYDKQSNTVYNTSMPFVDIKANATISIQEDIGQWIVTPKK